MNIFEGTVNKFVSNVINKKVNKDNEEDVEINKEGDNYSLSQLDNAYIIAYAIDENAEPGREFIGHVIKKFLEKEKDMEKLKKFLKDLLNAPNRLHNESFMHFFSINLVGNEEKVKLLEDLIKLGGYIELNRIGEREIKKDEKEIEKIKTRLRNLSIEETLKNQLYDKEVVKAVEDTPIGELPEELIKKILEYKKGGRRKSLKKKRKSKRKGGGTRGTKRKNEEEEEEIEEIEEIKKKKRKEAHEAHEARTREITRLKEMADEKPVLKSLYNALERRALEGDIPGDGVASIVPLDMYRKSQLDVMDRIRKEEAAEERRIIEAAESARARGGMVKSLKKKRKSKRRKSMKKKQRKTKRKGRK